LLLPAPVPVPLWPGLAGGLFCFGACSVSSSTLRGGHEVSDSANGSSMGVVCSFSRSETRMKDLKFEHKRSLSRREAADQLTALAAALREGGEAELELGSGTLSLRIPDELHSEMEIEVASGQIELEIEFTWPTASSRPAPPRSVEDDTEQAPKQKSPPAKPGQSGTGTGAGRSKAAKRSATKTP
jgi:amphi-Trp domain-containing protein